MSHAPPRSGLRRVGFWLALAVVLVISWRAAEVRPLALTDPASLAALRTFIGGLFPPDLSPDFLRTVLAATAQTVAIAVAGTALSILVGLPLGVLSTATLWRRGVLVAGERESTLKRLLALFSLAVRAALGFLRAVPDLMWGLLFVVAVGLGSLSGTLALAVSYSGVLGRVYADVFEDVDARPLEALHAGGATRAQIFLRAIWPQAAPSVAAYTLYSFECCVRAASVLGFVGAGGLGYEINISMRLFRYDQVLTLIVAFVVLLLTTDVFSRRARRRLHGATPARRVRLRALFTHGGLLRRRPFAWEKHTNLLTWVVVLTVVGWSLYATGIFSGALVERGILSRMARFTGAMLPPDFDPAFLRALLVPLVQTIGISVVGTLVGIVAGVLLAVPATSTLILTDPEAAGRRSTVERILRGGIYASARFALGVLRSIPELVWVLVFVIAVGFGPFAGTLALGLHTTGVLGKLYAETLEEVPQRPVEALRASGARGLQILAWGVWPQARPLLVSYTALRWEMNLRVSTILGLVGGGGLGQAIYNNVQLGFYQRVATLILIVYALVVATDHVGDRLRRKPVAV
ncbi:MAG TPA: phosphonate ABC transporter, permease protein PhnE [Pyrinomonadaceae bacterium]|nr:phosphonate ABC transporter, permease protein PhnE [Pyrinomonadaceae bacterium]